ncbi:hypothetical protein ABZ135_23525 [Streptomyces sp. NPDC006339]|uniref:hypothetical protein n=1 Tax=Streptomyces sp. NPDC006339 TaxID=3156755 RepID=UPI0033A1F63F
MLTDLAAKGTVTIADVPAILKHRRVWADLVGPAARDGSTSSPASTAFAVSRAQGCFSRRNREGVGLLPEKGEVIPSAPHSPGPKASV